MPFSPGGRWRACNSKFTRFVSSLWFLRCRKEGLDLCLAIFGNISGWALWIKTLELEEAKILRTQTEAKILRTRQKIKSCRHNRLEATKVAKPAAISSPLALNCFFFWHFLFFIGTHLFFVFFIGTYLFFLLALTCFFGFLLALTCFLFFLFALTCGSRLRIFRGNKFSPPLPEKDFNLGLLKNNSKLLVWNLNVMSNCQIQR